MTVMVLLLLGGAFALSFGVLSTQMLDLRRTITRLQRDMRVSSGETMIPEGESDGHSSE